MGTPGKVGEHPRGVSGVTWLAEHDAVELDRRVGGDDDLVRDGVGTAAAFSLASRSTYTVGSSPSYGVSSTPPGRTSNSVVSLREQRRRCGELEASTSAHASAAAERHHVPVVGNGEVVEVVEVPVGQRDADRAVRVAAPDPLAAVDERGGRVERGDEVVELGRASTRWRTGAATRRRPGSR